MTQILKMVAQRLALGLLTLFVVSLIIFLGIELLPGDLTQAILGQAATEETVAAFRKELKLDLPPHERYVAWLGGLLQGDLGHSLANKREITELMGVRLGNTIFLASVAAVIAIPLALALGILAALYRNTPYDRTVNVFTLSSISFPEFFVAYILIFVFSVQLGWFPSISNIGEELGFWDRVYRSILPALTLTLVVVAHMMRMTRAAIINLMASPYIEMANLKGLPRARIIVKHALPNALAPIINVIVINLAYLVVGVVIVEVVFVYPGLGQLLIDAVRTRDLPVVQATGLLFGWCLHPPEPDRGCVVDPHEPAPAASEIGDGRHARSDQTSSHFAVERPVRHVRGGVLHRHGGFRARADPVWRIGDRRRRVRALEFRVPAGDG